MSAGGHLRAYLFDEVQLLYKDRGQRSLDFWQWTKACQSQEGSCMTLIIMAAAYGDRRSDFRGSAGPESSVATFLTWQRSSWFPWRLPLPLLAASS